MKKIYNFIGLLFICFGLSAQIPTGYYQSAEGLYGSSLKSALSVIIDTQVDNGYNYLWTMYRTSDVRSNGKIWDMYSTCSFTVGSGQCGTYSQICDCYNREHMVPQSWFGERQPMKTDAFHIYPTDGKVNSLRSNYPHGETNASAIGFNALGKLGASKTAGYSGTVYEPDDEYKGDIARTYFYFVTRYESQLSSMNGTVLTTQAYPGLTNWFLNLMLTWHRNDPVSQKEINRNNAIAKAQSNRNPYIDYPDLVEHVWGNQKTSKWYAHGNGVEEQSEEVAITLYPVPANEYVTISGVSDVNWSYSIIDLRGVVMTQGVASQNGEIETSALADGLYLLYIKEYNQTKLLKLIVQHN